MIRLLTIDDYLISLLFFISCGFYTTLFGFSPVYILSLLAVFFSFYLVLKRFEFIFIRESSLLFFSFLPFILGQFFRSNELSNPINVNYIISILSYIFAAQVIFRLGLKQYLKVIRVGNLFYFILLFSELFYRLSHPSDMKDMLEASDGLVFYAYKASSFMFKDSNAVGVLVLYIVFFNEFVFMHYRKHFSFKYIQIFRVLSIILVIGTLSRAAIASGIIGYVFLLYFTYPSFRYIFRLLLPFVFFSIIITSINLVTGDSSGKHKVAEFEHMFQFLTFENVSIYDYFFGIGYGFGNEYTPTYIHTLPAKLVIEGGVLSSIFVFGFYFLVILRDKLSLVMLAPVFICYLSFSVYVFVPFSLIFICMLQYKYYRIV
ncbi:hypothetical protein [Vibrio sp. dhg]|uniref:hypothetical protein n=1 Tax=Vibrio sp. dhg TaxID=2163016 RepID=UPI000E46B80C|nr:hypothetical protein [Vibrio sp. dhg]AXT69686.1 hypothetical protein DBX26_00970 [Vibrio sp. dhg]